MSHPLKSLVQLTLAAWLAVGTSATLAADVNLADSPLFTTVAVPGNLAFALSVEWPTANTTAYSSDPKKTYSAANTYVGYFDPAKCYRYSYNSTTPKNSQFIPHSTTSSQTCTSSSSVPLWSGNYLNWASMQTMDVFRWALTGGYRSTDTVGNTILTKIIAKTPNSTSINVTAPDKTITTNITGATPFNWTTLTTAIQNQGISMLVTSTATQVSTVKMSPSTGCKVGYTCIDTANYTPEDYTGQNSYVTSDNSAYANPAKIYQIYINVRVCDPSVSIESNCTDYTSAGSGNYKPEGLMQNYAERIRFATFGYLNDTDNPDRRDGGVLRSPMKFIGPKKANADGTTSANSTPEWDSTTGIVLTDPESSLSAQFNGWTTWSGSINYINHFGQSLHRSTEDEYRYRRSDPVSELYYAVTRYYRNVGNVASYSELPSNDFSKILILDEFPIVTDWSTTAWQSGAPASSADPIIYACQKNFILGIGDVYANNDANLPGALDTLRGKENTMPTEVSSDAAYVDVVKSTKMVAQLEDLADTLATEFAPKYCPPPKKGQTISATCRNPGTNNTFYIAGLAYDVHTTDIRSDIPDTQTISTYWLDVKENDVYVSKNPYWMAAKYGGFTVPSGFEPYSAGNGPSTLNLTDWYNTTDTLLWTDPVTLNEYSDQRPDNYFAADQGDVMVAALKSAFAKIASELGAATTTAFSSATRKSTTTDNANYAASYDPTTWTGKVVGSSISYDANFTPTLTQIWDARSLLETTTPEERKIITCCEVTTDDDNGSPTQAGLAFTVNDLSNRPLISRTYVASFSDVPGVTSQSRSNFIAYLRGDRDQELNKGGVYRNRTYLLGDIVNSKPTAVASPSRPYYDSYNPGYGAFKRKWSTRSTVVYIGANDGMMHAFDGSLSSTTRGMELFAYIPSFVYGSSSTASTTGLASLGNPSFTHHYFVDATPLSFDIDLSNTYNSGTSTPDWRTVIIGGLGKGGKGYYAIDVTDPSSWTSESVLSSKVLWEFTHEHMGYSYGDAHVVKTEKYGWVVLLTSGYNNDDGKGYLFVVNPKTGALLEAIATPDSATTPVNFGQMRSFIPNVADYTADAVYIGDLQGNLWRFDLTGTPNAYPAPVLLAQLRSSSGDVLPITASPMIGVDPSTLKRYVMVGTGRLLHSSDIDSNNNQTFFAMVDGTYESGRFYTAETIPDNYSLPITRSQLTEVTDLTQGLNTVNATPSAMGWYYDVAGGITTDGDVYNGVVAFGVNNTDDSSACNPSGTSAYYAVRFASGASVLVGSDGTTIVDSVLNESGIVTEISVQSVNGTILVTAGDSSGKVTTLRIGTVANATQRLNWREISTID
ncbi:pilus assembly protein [Vitreoscilla filiformis]|uniref:pilus assembly protein n=1 Tax=Vitreoscilla filiformis TaxID=63 RepID=UPI000B7A0B5B|nr:PilC/PilY family type IV pilus protein [Vitreoscilla filiformis]